MRVIITLLYGLVNFTVILNHTCYSIKEDPHVCNLEESSCSFTEVSCAGTHLGIELNKNAVMNARFNAQENDIGNVRFIHGRAERGVGELAGGEKIVVDPPRAGLGPALIAELIRLRPEVIVYASCDTATFSRDAGTIHESGYRLREMSLVDMFPRTSHIEVVSRFTPV